MSRAGWLVALAASAATLGSVVAWEREPAPIAADAAALDGAMLFRAKGCAGCHAGPDTAPVVDAGFPSLATAGSWAGDRRPDLTAPEYLAESIREPWAFISPGRGGPAGAMPALELSDAETTAIVEYLLAS